MRYYRDAATREGHSKAGHGFDLALGMDSYANEGKAVVSLTKTSFA